MNMAMGWTSKLVLAFVTLLIGVVLLSQVSTEGQARTTTDTTLNEYISVRTANNGTGINASVVFGPVANTGDTNDDCLMTAVSISNSTGTNLTSATDYTFDTSEGTYTLANSSFPYISANNVTNVSYTYCPTGYVNLAWGRTAIDLVPGFFAIALLLVSIALFYSVYRDWGVR